MHCRDALVAQQGGEISNVGESPGRGITIRAPQASVPKISAIETSKLGEATCSSRSVSSTSYSPLNQTKYSATGRCGTATPLGNPVVPDV